MSLNIWLWVGALGTASVAGGSVACGHLWHRARDRKRSEARAQLQALGVSQALCEAFEPLIRLSQELLAHASISSDPPSAVATGVFELRARAEDLDARIAADAKALHDPLAAAGVDLSTLPVALRQAEKALEEVYLLATRSSASHTSELFRANARYASAQMSMLAQLLAQLRDDIRQRELMLKRLAA